MYISTYLFRLAIDRPFEKKRCKDRHASFFQSSKYSRFNLIFNFYSNIARKVNAQNAGRPAAGEQIARAAPVLAPTAAPQNGHGGLGAQQIAVIAAAVIGPEAVQPHGHGHGKQ
jgi:hypothetical protein